MKSRLPPARQPVRSTWMPARWPSRLLLETSRKAWRCWPTRRRFRGSWRTFATIPANRACRRLDAGDAIAVGLLERACAEFGGPTPAIRPHPANHKRVAVVGGGLSGVSAAIRLAIRGYAVTVFEARSRLLERMRSLDGDALPAAAIDADLAVLVKLGVTVHCDALISRHAGPFGLEAIVADYEAVYLATGPELFDESSLGLERTAHGRLRIDPLTLATSQPKVFAGGAQRYGPAAYSPVNSVADGNYAAVSIDRFLQGASLTANRDNQGPYCFAAFCEHQQTLRRRRLFRWATTRMDTRKKRPGRRQAAASLATASNA